MSEENTNTENKTINVGDCRSVCEKHPLLKSIFIGLLIFLGAFCAFYTVSDWHFKRMMHPVFERDWGMPDKMIKKQMLAADKMFRADKNMTRRSANIIHLEQNDDQYRVLIDLRAFDNNENNLQVSANGNILTINGRSIRKSKNNEQISEFQQNYMFGQNVKLSEIEKETNGNYYVITIPIENEQ